MERDWVECIITGFFRGLRYHLELKRERERERELELENFILQRL